MNPDKSLLSRAIRVIDAVSRSGQGVRFSEAASLLDNPSPSTVSKILKELVREGILQKTAEGRYALGRKVYFWGRAMAAQNTPIQTIRHQMQRLHRQLRISVNLFTCADSTMFCLESYLDPQSPLLYPAGKSLPLRLSVQGAVFFIADEKLADPAFLEEEADLIEEPLTAADLADMIAHARTNAMQEDPGLFYPGIHRFAIPLREKGQTVMVLGVGLSAKRAGDAAFSEAIVTELRNVQAVIEDGFE